MADVAEWAIPAYRSMAESLKKGVIELSTEERQQALLNAMAGKEPEPDQVPVAHPCPFCGGGSLDMDIRKAGLGPIIEEYRVECLLCHVRGRKAGSAFSAVELWNRRKPPWPEKPEPPPDEWISVEDRLPEDGRRVWAYDPEIYGQLIAHYWEGPKWIGLDGGSWTAECRRLYSGPFRVTHWREFITPEVPGGQPPP